MGRACIALAQGNLAGAWHYHPFAFFLIPLALGLACSPSRFGRAWLVLPPSVRKGLAGGMLALVLVLWGYSLAALLVAQRPNRDISTHFEGVESLALRVAVDAGVLPAVA